MCLGLVAANGVFSCPLCALPKSDWAKSHKGAKGFEIEKFRSSFFFHFLYPFLEIKDKKISQK